MVLAAAKLVILILLCLSPEPFPFSNDRICLVNIDKTAHTHWHCKYSQDWLDSSFGSIVSFHAAAISELTI